MRQTACIRPGLVAAVVLALAGVAHGGRPLWLLGMVSGGPRPSPAPATQPHPRGRDGWGGDVRLSSGAGEARLAYNFARSIAADGEGGLHGVWYEKREGRSEVRYRRSSDGGATWTAEVLLSASTGSAVHPAVAAAGRRVYAKESADGGATWGPDVRVTRARGESQHVSLAARGADVHAIWFDERDGRPAIYTARRSRR
jgi:hypothetical protein